MSNNAIAGVGPASYPWNPFQDMVSNRVKGEVITVNPTPQGSIVIPRCAPFFGRDVKITMQGSGRELSLKAGEYSFLYPFGDFIGEYSRLVYSGVVIHNVTQPTNFLIDYDTIGSNFVLDDIAYLQAVANTLTNPRIADWGDLTNLPGAWPSDPHEHPASDTFNYEDMIISLRSYVDALTGEGNPASIQSLLEQHLKADLQSAHKATLEDLGIAHLKDWAMAERGDVTGNSTELLVNIDVLKHAIRAYEQGLWT